MKRENLPLANGYEMQLTELERTVEGLKGEITISFNYEGYCGSGTHNLNDEEKKPLLPIIRKQLLARFNKEIKRLKKELAELE